MRNIHCPALRKAGIKKETGDDLEAGEVLTEKGAQPILCGLR